jgi:hypothetical protein
MFYINGRLFRILNHIGMTKAEFLEPDVNLAQVILSILDGHVQV